MKNKIGAQRFQRGVALLLCFVLSPSTGLFSSDIPKNAAGETVGTVTGVVSAGAQNGIRARLKDVVRASDNLTTDRSGRLRIELQDGSILSAGSDTQLKIVNHDALTGETLVDLGNGRLRSQVVRVRRSGKFEITTPHATITALGTDFFVDVSAPSTQVFVYSGVVVVAAGRGPADAGSRFVVDVPAGQNVVIDGRGISHLQITPDEMQQQTIAETTVPEEYVPVVAEKEPTAKKPSHAARNTLLVGLAAGAIAGAVLGLRGSKSQQPAAPTPTIPPTIPPH